MKRVSKVTNRGWRRGYFAAAALALAAVCVLLTASALGDAGNPILKTIEGEVVEHSNGTVTVYVHGQWNWLSHNSDCNTDRAGAGVGIIWNDPTEPGYTVAKGSISAGVGISKLREGDTVNKIDQMVHPSDLGNVAEGYPGFTGQTFKDPAPSPKNYKEWRGGCGREPLTATASPGPGTAAHPSGTPCANGTTNCSGHPWGSWGYQPAVNDGEGQGYKHTYAKRSDITQVCVNFYDVHGGGTGSKLQLVNGENEVTVNKNGDNSIQTNAFNTEQGANCVKLPVAKAKLETKASGPVTIGAGSSISDTATLSGGSNPTGSITFNVYAPNADGSADTLCSTFVTTLKATKTVNGDGNYTSEPFTPSGTAPQIAGTYEWKASYSGDTNNEPVPLTECNATGEQSVVERHPSSVPTGQKVLISDYANVTASSGTPTGSVKFELFETSGCTGAPLFTGSATLDSSGLAHVEDTTPLKENGTYSWLVRYSGSSGTAVSPCGTELTKIEGNTPGVDP